VKKSKIGISEWFHVWDKGRVDQALEDLQTLGIKDLRTGVSWADFLTEEGEEWYTWLLPHLAQHVDLLPCFTFTPPSLGIAKRSSAPPRNPKDYADWLDLMLTRHGDCFEYAELWNGPNDVALYEWTLDPDWRIFTEMVGGAAHWLKHRGKKTVLGGIWPIDANWVGLMARCGVLEYVDVVAVKGFPGSTNRWDGWDVELGRVREILARYNSEAEIWITETGFSTWRHDCWGQASTLLNALEAPAKRVYWHGLRDLDPEKPTMSGLQMDPREYFFGLKSADNREKPIFRIWTSLGLDGIRELQKMTPHVVGSEKHTLITGGAGFIGTNVADRELEAGRKVLLFDNLSRPGVEHNFEWLRRKHGEQVQLQVGDMRDSLALRWAVRNAREIYHFAAQVAVTTSIDKPSEDYEVNARGTFNLLEEVRRLDDPPPVLFTSTNKVYGDLADIPLKASGQRYEPIDSVIRSKGVSEARSLDFHSPYGCSKGTADQYVLDYCRTYDIPAVVFRMSCIYGPHQFGNEDQGWVAHFLIKAMRNETITLYGDGKQVRDILFATDLVKAMRKAMSRIKVSGGNAFNVGGGPANTISLLELLDLIEEMRGESVDVRFSDWRTGDQRYYVSDTSKIQRALAWRPTTGVREGVRKLAEWLRAGSPLLTNRQALFRGEDSIVRKISLR
jgi:CDP-paratose 2-epimerase